MKSALRTPRIALAGTLMALLAGCYSTGYVAVRHDRAYHHYPYHSSYYSGYANYGTRYYSSGPYYRPYSYRYYSGGGPSLNLSYTRTTYRAPSYRYSTAPLYSTTTYVASSPRYSASAVRVSSARAAPANGAGKVHGKGHAKHKGHQE